MTTTNRNQSRVTIELNSVTRARRTVDTMLWIIVAGTIFYSLMTSTPLVSAHSPWPWSGWALGILTDAAFVLSISADSILSRFGMGGGKWPGFFRWTTGLASLFLNVWGSVEHRDWVGVAIHAIPPVILVCASEVAPIYRRRFRDLEQELGQVVTEERATKAVTPKKKAGTVTRNSEPVVTPTPVTQTEARVTPLVTHEGTVTPKKQAIRDAYLEGLSATEAAQRIGVSRPYVSKQYAAIREELDQAA